jgi:RNase H-like protein
MILYTDGGCSGNGQTDLSRREMVMVVTANDGELLIHECGRGGSNHIAELRAVVSALDWCVRPGVEDVTIRTNSTNNLGMDPQQASGQTSEPTALPVVNANRTRADAAVECVPLAQNLTGHVIEEQYGLCQKEWATRTCGDAARFRRT